MLCELHAVPVGMLLYLQQDILVLATISSDQHTAWQTQHHEHLHSSLIQVRVLIVVSLRHELARQEGGTLMLLG